MKSDLDALMQVYDVDAVLVSGSGQHNPMMVYLTGGGHLTMADLVKKRGEPAVLFHAPMERDEAARSGLRTQSYVTYPEFRAALRGDLEQSAQMLKKMLAECGFTTGRLAIYGQVDAHQFYGKIARLQALVPGIEIVDGTDENVLLMAMATKDAEEVARIQRMGRVTSEVVAETADLLTGSAVKDGFLFKPDGQPLTVGDVKRQIDLWLMARGAENPEGTIFAIGRDAGVPHSTGSAGDVLRLGETIVFDIFPCETGGGYFHDFTRTWCLGFAPDETMKVYEQVRSVYESITKELKVGEPFYAFQKRTCELFEAMGHASVLSDPATENGYVHSLGHGVGLKVHEMPACSYQAEGSQANILAAGQVIAIEPGLYYPEKGMGVRLENTFYISPEGQFVNLAPYPLDLVLPIRG